MKVTVLYAPDEIHLTLRAVRKGMDHYKEFLDYLKRYNYSGKKHYAFFSEEFDVKYEVEFDANDKLVKILHVGSGLLTDLASIPEIPIIYGHYKLLCPMAAIPHDQGYVLGTVDDSARSYITYNGKVHVERIPFHEINLLFEALLKYYGIDDFDRTTMYDGVAVGGIETYNSHKLIEDADPTDPNDVYMELPFDTKAPPEK